jgi:DNA polymerase-3 subunit gamma/tau
MVDYLRALLLVRSNNAALIDATPEIRQQMARHAAQFEMPRLLETIRLFNAAASETRSSWQPGLGLELALAQAAAQVEAPPVQQPAGQQTAAGDAGKPARTATSSTPAGSPPPDLSPLQRAAPAQPAAAPPARPARSQPAAEENLPPQGALGAPEAAGQSAPTGESGPGLAEIRANWLRIRAEVKKHNGLTEAALNSSRTFTLKDGVLILGYQTELVKKKMETEENLALLRQAIQAVLGVTFRVRCIVVGNKTTIENEDLEVEGDGIVRTALDLGAKIVYKE